ADVTREALKVRIEPEPPRLRVAGQHRVADRPLAPGVAVGHRRSCNRVRTGILSAAGGTLRGKERAENKSTPLFSDSLTSVLRSLPCPLASPLLNWLLLPLGQRPRHADGDRLESDRRSVGIGAADSRRACRGCGCRAAGRLRVSRTVEARYACGTAIAGAT